MATRVRKRAEESAAASAARKPAERRVANATFVRGGFWETARRAARHVPFMEEIVAAYYCALDWNTPFRVKGILLAALAYFVLPTDTVPDFILGIGFTDDIAVLTAAIASVRSHISPAHREAARKALAKD